MIAEKQLLDYKQTVIKKGMFSSFICLSFSVVLMVINVIFYFSQPLFIYKIIFNILLTVIWLILLAYSYLEYLERDNGIYLYTKGILIIENNNRVAFSYKEIDYFSEYNDIGKDEHIDILTFNTQSSFRRRQRRFLFILKNKRAIKTIYPTTKKELIKLLLLYLSKSSTTYILFSS